MQYFDSYLKIETSQNGIISFELAKDLPESMNIINNWKENNVIAAAGLNLGFDFVFILAYTSFISLLLFLVTYLKTGWIKVLGKILIWTTLLAGFVDVVENISLINLLLGVNSQLYASLAYYLAFIKFTLILISIFFIVIITLKDIIYVFFKETK